MDRPRFFDEMYADGTPYDRRPATAAEAAARRAARFAASNEPGRRIGIAGEPANPLFLLTLDLRYRPA